MDDERVGAVGEDAYQRADGWRFTGSARLGGASTARTRNAHAPVTGAQLQGPAGQRTDVGHRPPPGLSPVDVHLVREIPAHWFDRCPICLTHGPSTREHIPPAALGGAVRTSVCQRCNNDLGSRIEVDLLDWRDSAVRGVRISGGAVPGFRKLERLLRRTTADGKFALIAQGRRDLDVDEILASGAFQLEVIPPDPAKYQLAALKHAYLAACLDLREIPDTATARQIRSGLLAARDAPRGSTFPISDYAGSITLMRSYEQHAGPPLALGRIVGAARPDGHCENYILLGGSLCVSWPLPDAAPAP